MGFQQHGEIKLVFHGIARDYLIIFDIPYIYIYIIVPRKLCFNVHIIELNDGSSMSNSCLFHSSK